MAYSLLYSTGTVSVANGSTAVTGTGVTWSSVREGDTLRDPATGAFAMIASIESTSGALTLLWPWPGTDLSDDAYIITYDSPSRRSAVTLSATLETFVANQTLLLAQRTDIYLTGYGVDTPPGSPVVGDTYIVGSAPTDAWVGAAGYIATWTSLGTWAFNPPAVGTEAVDTSVDPPIVYIRGASSWVPKDGAHELSDLSDVDPSGASDGDVLGYSSGAWSPATPEAHRGRNLLFNPCGLINQREATSKGDDAYGFDRWNVLTQTGAVGLSTLTAPADGIAGMMRLTQSQATAQRMGQAQILEAADSRWMRGRTMTLSGKARCSAAATLRYAILSWEGTADSPTKDVVLDWTSGSYAAGGFFLGAGLGVVAVGSLALSAGVMTSMAALSAAMPSGLNNAAVVYWSEGALAQDVTLDAALQLEEGDTAHPLDIRPVGWDLALCRRYFQVIGAGEQAYEQVGLGVASSGTELRVPVVLSPVMRRAPTITLSSNSHWAIAGTAGAISGFSTEAVTKQSAMLKPAVASGLTTNAAYRFEAFGTTSARIFLDAEF